MVHPFLKGALSQGVFRGIFIIGNGCRPVKCRYRRNHARTETDVNRIPLGCAGNEENGMTIKGEMP